MPVKPARQPLSPIRAYIEASARPIEQSRIDADRQAAIEWAKHHPVKRLPPGMAWCSLLNRPKGMELTC